MLAVDRKRVIERVAEVLEDPETPPQVVIHAARLLLDVLPHAEDEVPAEVAAVRRLRKVG